MMAWLNFQARLPLFGTSSDASRHSSAFRIPRSTFPNALLITLATFVSTAGTGFSYANEAIAPAVYGPTPGSLTSSSGSSGNVAS